MLTRGEVIALVIAAIAASGAWVTARYGRLARVEARLARVEAQNTRLWLYVRAQHDHSYRNGVTPLDIPDDLFDTKGE